MNLQFAGQQTPNSTIRITREDGTEVFQFAPDTHDRRFSGLILSAPSLKQGETYQVWINNVPQQYTGTDVGMGGPRSRGMEPGQRPEGVGVEPPKGMVRPELPERELPPMPEGSFNGKGPGNGGIPGEPSTDFYMNDKVNAFSGVTAKKQ